MEERLAKYPELKGKNVIRVFRFFWKIRADFFPTS